MGIAGGLASGYHGPPALTAMRVFTEWTPDPPMLVLVLLLGGGYLAGARRRPDWPAARRIWFLGLGLGSVVIATMSCIGVYQPVLFYARAIQTVLLVLVAVPFVMYFTSWYTAVFHSAAIRELTYLALLAPGFAFFWTLLRVDPVPKEYSYAVSMWITGAEVIGDAFIGLAIIADQNLIGAAWYHALARPWGPTLQADQVIGGGALWILGDLVGLPFLAAQLIQLMREDESDAARIDADLDARDADLATAAAAAAASEPEAGPAKAGTAKAGTGQAEKPWWEDDPRFTSRFKPS